MRPALPALALVALLATTACSSGEELAAPAASPQAVTGATQEPTEPPAPAATSQPPAAPEVRTISLSVAGGTVTGDTGRVPVPLGSTFRLVVDSDVADEVHVHGYDEYLDLAPGVPASVEILADKPGIFEVELHDAGTLLTRLQVS